MLQEEDANCGQVSVRSHDDATVDEVYDSYTDDQQNDLDNMKTNGDIYKDLTRSIAPQVFGHDDIKRAVLLMLFGGVHKQTKEASTFTHAGLVLQLMPPSAAQLRSLYSASDLIQHDLPCGQLKHAHCHTPAVVTQPSESLHCWSQI